MEDSKFIFGFGLSDDWSFEKDYKKLSGAKIICYDLSVNGKYWLIRFCKDLINMFFLRDIKFFEFLAEDIIKFYKYNFIFKNKKKIYFNFLPMKCELLVWKNTFKHGKIKHIFSIPFFYLKRILLINKFSIKNKYLPYSLGSNKK